VESEQPPLLSGKVNEAAWTIRSARSRPRSLIAKLTLFVFVAAILAALIFLAWTTHKQQQRIEFLEFQNRLAAAAEESESTIILRLDRQFPESAVLDLGSKTYSSLVTSNGIFYVKVEGAEPYLDGYKIHLLIGNPLSARYSEVKLRARWGPASHYNPNDPYGIQRENSLHKQDYVVLPTNLDSQGLVF
jgi:hypothetical protein